MRWQRVMQPRSAASEFDHPRVEREIGTRMESKSNSSKLSNAGVPTENKGGGYRNSSWERLIYLTTCLVGHNVKVRVKDGSLFFGILIALNAEEGFGIISNMAHSIPAGSPRGQKAPSRTFIIPVKELMQIMEDVNVMRDGLMNQFQRVQPQDTMLDSSITEAHHVKMDRELKRWVPNEDDLQCSEMENIFDGHWNRGWDQFEVNERLFGVKSTFDEELYTTKLVKGPQTRELEEEASRIAREIESEETQDLHLAEVTLYPNQILAREHFLKESEESFSSNQKEGFTCMEILMLMRKPNTHPPRGVDDSGYDVYKNILSDSRNTETFGGASGSIISRSFTDLTSGRTNDGAQVSSSYPPMDKIQSSQSSTGCDLMHSGSNDQAIQLSSETLSKNFPPMDGGSRVEDNQLDELDAEKHGCDKGGLSPNSTAYGPSPLPPEGQVESTSNDLSEDVPILKAQGAKQSVDPRGLPGNSTPSTPNYDESASAMGGPGLLPSSSMGSLSSITSTLNPNAEEFTPKPNERSFIPPSQTPLGPVCLVSDCTSDFPPNVAAVPPLYGRTLARAIAPFFDGHQPVLINPQVAPMQLSEAYINPNAHQLQYRPQITLVQPGFVDRPTYPPEPPDERRNS